MGRQIQTDNIEIGSERFNQLAPKIQAKLLRAKEIADAKAERAEKKQQGAELSDEARLEQLRQIPGPERTADEKREYATLYQRYYREGRAKQLPTSKVATAQEFWEANRATLTKAKLEELLAQQELVDDQIFWMEHGGDCNPSDPDYVSLQDGLKDLDAFVKEHGLIHDESQACQHWWLQDFRGTLFALEDMNEAERTTAFFKDLGRFNLFLHEGEATAVYAKYGVRISLFAFGVRTFKQRLAEHERAKLQMDVRRAHVEFESARCWLCRAWSAQQARDAEGTTPQGPEPPSPTIA